jgi:hypothetical protein
MSLWEIEGERERDWSHWLASWIEGKGERETETEGEERWKLCFSPVMRESVYEIIEREWDREKGRRIRERGRERRNKEDLIGIWT